MNVKKSSPSSRLIEMLTSNIYREIIITKSQSIHTKSFGASIITYNGYLYTSQR